MKFESSSLLSSKSLIPSLIGGSVAGIAELSVFHPLDTIAKRLMTNQQKIIYSGPDKNLGKIILGRSDDMASRPLFKSLFPGLGYAAGYKVLQRTYKFGLQPYVSQVVSNTSFGALLEKKYGSEKAKIFNSASAGALLGAGEVILLPLDVLKIRSQTSIGAPILMKNFYSGWEWTIMRNVPGSFALFGGSAFYHSVLRKKNNDPSLLDHGISSVIGATSSIIISAPMDVVKTRIQSGRNEGLSGTAIVRGILRNEGLGAFFKGLVPKLFVVGPKLVFSMTISQYIHQMLTKSL